MKKVVVFLATLILVSTTAAFAQSSKQHGVNVEVPSLLRIRFTAGTSTTDIATPDNVEFIFDATTYDVGTFGPTNAAPFNWDDVKVFYNGLATWSVTVTNSGDLTFDWSKIVVTPNGSGAMAAAAAFDLTETAPIHTGAGKTSGWLSLGFGPADYGITFDGAEDPGAYSSTVTYSIATP